MDDLKQQIDQLMINKEYKLALALIESELQQLYLPPGFEADYLRYKQEIKAAEPVVHPTIDAQTCFDMLLHNQNTTVALKHLQNVPLIKHTQAIQEVLDTLFDRLIVGYIIEMLIEQKVVETFTLKPDGLLIEFNPLYVLSIQDNDAIKDILALFARVFENDNPSLMNMCQSALVQEALAHLPLSVETEDVSILGFAIIKAVLFAMNDAQQWQQIQAEYRVNESTLWELKTF